MKRISRYWKYQLIGWSVFTLVDTILSALYLTQVNDSALLMYGRVVLVTLLGLLVTDVMHRVIQKFNPFQKSPGRQIIYLSVITVCFTFFWLLTWMCIYFLFELRNVTESKQTYFGVFYWVGYGFFATIFVWNLIYFMVHYVQRILENERQKIISEKQLLEMEAMALRAQMNPHFIFNCMNSIKSLIQKDEDEKALNYLATFSDLIHTVFLNSDKREITLFDEVQTCRLYVQLESMRFGDKLNYNFKIDKNVDMKAIKVPALIIQPFIENAIWHGIMPKEEGGILTVSVEKKGTSTCCIVDDDGVGREVSGNIKAGMFMQHKSKGVHLTQSRLDLDNILNQRKATVNIIDKKGMNSKKSGTQIVLLFN